MREKKPPPQVRFSFARFAHWQDICSLCEGCSFSDVRRSVKEEVVVQYTYNIHMPTKYSPSLRTHSPSCLRQGSKVFLTVGWRQCVQLCSYCFCEVQKWVQDYRWDGSEPGCFTPLGRSQWPRLSGLCSALGSICFRHNWWHHIFSHVKQPFGWWGQDNVAHGDSVWMKVSPDTNFNRVPYKVYKWQGDGHYKTNIPRSFCLPGWFLLKSLLTKQEVTYVLNSESDL